MIDTQSRAKLSVMVPPGCNPIAMHPQSGELIVIKRNGAEPNGTKIGTLSSLTPILSAEALQVLWAETNADGTRMITCNQTCWTFWDLRNWSIINQKAAPVACDNSDYYNSKMIFKVGNTLAYYRLGGPLGGGTIEVLSFEGVHLKSFGLPEPERAETVSLNTIANVLLYYSPIATSSTSCVRGVSMANVAEGPNFGSTAERVRKLCSVSPQDWNDAHHSKLHSLKTEALWAPAALRRWIDLLAIRYAEKLMTPGKKNFYRSAWWLVN